MFFNVGSTLLLVSVMQITVFKGRTEGDLWRGGLQPWLKISFQVIQLWQQFPLYLVLLNAFRKWLTFSSITWTLVGGYQLSQSKEAGVRMDN